MTPTLFSFLILDTEITRPITFNLVTINSQIFVFGYDQITWDLDITTQTSDHCDLL
jgi:hypothetical protein